MPSATPTPTATAYIPTVDISPFFPASDGLTTPDLTPSPAKTTALAQIRHACLNHGFFLITGHPIPADLQREVLRQAAAFFALPLEAKLALDEKHAYGRSHRGYQVLGGEGNQPGKGPDLKEAFQLGHSRPPTDPHVAAARMLVGPNQWPPEALLPGFRATMEAYFGRIRALALAVLRLLAATLDLEYEDAFAGFTDESSDLSAVRLLRYPPMGEGTREKGVLGTGAHTDFGAVTLLLTDEVAGLQVFDGEAWTDVVPNPDAYIVNLGDMFTRFTGGLYKSSLHRVVNTSSKERYSVPYFYDGALDAVLSPLIDVEPVDEEWTMEEYMVRKFREQRERGVGGGGGGGGGSVEGEVGVGY